METLVAVAQHRNQHQYYSRNGDQGSMKFGSPPSGNFRGINCRTFQSAEGFLRTPLKSCSTATPVAKKTFFPALSPKTPSPHEHPKISKSLAKSGSVPIPIKIKFEKKQGEFNFSERWAGPAYSNSPPPSSLPIPKFSLCPKRTVSLELTSVASEFDLRLVAKSAPTSPMRGRAPSPSDLFDSDVSATETLRRILHLDIADE